MYDNIIINNEIHRSIQFRIYITIVRNKILALWNKLETKFEIYLYVKSKSKSLLFN